VTCLDCPPVQAAKIIVDGEECLTPGVIVSKREEVASSVYPGDGDIMSVFNFYQDRFGDSKFDAVFDVWPQWRRDDGITVFKKETKPVPAGAFIEQPEG